MVIGDVIVRPYPEIMGMAAATAHLICCHGVNRAVCQGVHSLFVGSRVAPVSYTHLDVYKRQVHGGYYELGEKIGKFGWSVEKKK